MTNVTMLVRNRPRLTRQALASLGRRSDANTAIVNDRSDYETCLVLDEFRLYTIRNAEAMGTGPLRNMVIKASEQAFGRGDYLYLSDNDVFFKQGWLEKLIWAYEQVRPDFAVIGGYNHPFNQPIHRWLLSDGVTQIHEVAALATQSMLMSWDVWDRFGPFCETPIDRVCQSEDVDFSNRVHKAGFKIGVVSPALIISTGITNTFGEPIPGWELVKAQAPAGVIVE